MKRGQRRRDEEDEQQRQGVDDAGHRRSGPGADVGRGAGDGAGGRDAAEQRRDHVGHALGDQFHVGLVLVAAHVVGHHRRQQALDGRQHGDRDGRRQQRHDQVGAELRHGEPRQARSECRRTCCRWSRRAGRGPAQATVAASRATMEPGTRFVSRGQRTTTAREATASPAAVQLIVPRCLREHPQPARRIRRARSRPTGRGSP